MKGEGTILILSYRVKGQGQFDSALCQGRAGQSQFSLWQDLSVGTKFFDIVT